MLHGVLVRGRELQSHGGLDGWAASRVLWMPLNVHNWLNLEEESVTLNGDPGSEGHCDAFERPHPFWVLSSWGEGELSEELSWAALVAAV